jgi:hypothetical protein
VHTGQQLWDWTIGGNPIPGMLVAALTDRQREDIIRVLDGMIRERSGGNGPVMLTAPLNIGVGRTSRRPGAPTPAVGNGPRLGWQLSDPDRGH